MENHPAILLLKYVYLIIPMHTTTFHFNNNILMNYRDIKPKREKCITSLQHSDVRPSTENTFIPCVVLAKDGNSQETFPGLRK